MEHLLPPAQPPAAPECPAGGARGQALPMGHACAVGLLCLYYQEPACAGEASMLMSCSLHRTRGKSSGGNWVAFMLIGAPVSSGPAVRL